MHHDQTYGIEPGYIDEDSMLAQELENCLLEAGVPGESVPEVITSILPTFKRMVAAKAAITLRELVFAAGETRPAQVLRRVFLGDKEPTLREIAAAAGVSHIAVYKQERKLKAQLSKLKILV